MIKRHYYDEEYLDWYYNKDGWKTTIFGTDGVSGLDLTGMFTKAVTPWDPPTSPYGEYFESVFSATIQAYVDRNTEIWKLLPKTTFLREGDSLKYYETDLSGAAGVVQGAAPFTAITQESGPSLVSLEGIRPAYIVDPWTTDFQSRVQSTWQTTPTLTPAGLKTYHAELFPDQLDAMLGLTIDTPANIGTASAANLESIDRIVSCDNESNTTYCSAAADGDLFWGNTSAKIDRDADTDNTFGGGGGTDAPGISLPTTGAARVLSLDYIDDAIIPASKYSKTKRYIMLMGPKTLNELQKLIDPKERYAHGEMWVQHSLNGVQTRTGHDAGFQVASYVSNGIKMPIFTSQHVANENAANRSATVTDADIGNIYMIDLDNIELRMAFPISYFETPLRHMLTMNSMVVRHMLLIGAQLFSNNMRSMAAVKYLKST